MGRVNEKRRHTKIRQKLRLKKKLQKLSVAHSSTSSVATKKKIVEKMGRVSPTLNVEEYLKR